MKTMNLATALAVPQLPDYLTKLGAKLQTIIPRNNPYIAEPLTRLLQVSGKRLRPSLVIAIALQNKATTSEKVLQAATAIELVHLASLIHDDIIDEADTRWNIPTINKAEGVSRAILVGDYLLGKAGEQAAEVNEEVAKLVSSAIAALCEGQALELQDQYNLARTPASYLRSIEFKTAALFSAACQIGAILAGLTRKEIVVLEDFGRSYGMSFQILDDILDFVASPAHLGKPTHHDIYEGNYTLPLLLGIKSIHGKELRKLITAKQKIDFTTLNPILKQEACFMQVLQLATEYNQTAQAALHKLIGKSTFWQHLQVFPTNYTASVLVDTVLESSLKMLSYS